MYKYVYKYMTPNKTTRNGYKWKLKRWHQTDEKGDGWLYSYEDPFQGMVMKHFHVHLANPIMFLCKATGKFSNDISYGKFASTALMPLKQIDQPIITGEYLKLLSMFCSLKQTFTIPIKDKRLGSTKKTYYWMINYLSNKKRADSEGQKILSNLDKSNKYSGYRVLSIPASFSLKYLSSILNVRNNSIFSTIPVDVSRNVFYGRNVLPTIREFNDRILSGEIPITEKRSEILKSIKMAKKYANKVD